MKPRIFINMHYLHIGGAETSLIGLLQTLDPQRVDVDLFLNDRVGEMMAYIPKWVNVLPEIMSYKMIESPIVDALKHGCVSVAVARLWAKVLNKIYACKKHPKDGCAISGFINKCVTPVLPSLKHLGEYDLAIAFLPPYGIVLDKVCAKKKVSWIHTDYTQIDVNQPLELSVWGRYDNIISISQDVTRTFCEIYPTLRNKIIEIENILSPQFVLRRAVEEPAPTDMPKEKDGYTLLTIGRFSPQKKIEEIPAICRRIKENGLSVKWYIIGYGISDDYIRKAIADEGMEDFVVILGKRSNPYPYIKACDWYVQPSRYEGKSVVVREAQMLCKPVIITAYPTSASQVQNGVDGVIVPMPIEECANAMVSALTNEQLKSDIVEYLSTHDYGNESEVEKVYNLI